MPHTGGGPPARENTNTRGLGPDIVSVLRLGFAKNMSFAFSMNLLDITFRGGPKIFTSTILGVVFVLDQNHSTLMDRDGIPSRTRMPRTWQDRGNTPQKLPSKVARH
jgi:hypothetical protein